MDKRLLNHPFFDNLDHITKDLAAKRLADVFRFVSFVPFEPFRQHQHLRIEINYVKKGGCIIRLEDECVSFKEGEMMIICSNVPHFFQAGGDGCTLMQLEFLPDIFMDIRPESENERLEDSPFGIFTSGNRLIKIVNDLRIMRAIQRIVTEMKTRDKYYQHLVVMYYAELLILIYRHMDETYMPMCLNESMKQAILYIRQHYQEDISMKDVARNLGFGERYLRKLFSQYLNMSPVAYINEIRVNKAIELLSITEMSVKEVCFKCGFKSPQYFSRVFKKQMGASPKSVVK